MLLEEKLAIAKKKIRFNIFLLLSIIIVSLILHLFFLFSKSIIIVVDNKGVFFIIQLTIEIVATLFIVGIITDSIDCYKELISADININFPLNKNVDKFLKDSFEEYRDFLLHRREIGEILGTDEKKIKSDEEFCKFYNITYTMFKIKMNHNFVDYNTIVSNEILLAYLEFLLVTENHFSKFIKKRYKKLYELFCYYCFKNYFCKNFIEFSCKKVMTNFNKDCKRDRHFTVLRITDEFLYRDLFPYNIGDQTFLLSEYLNIDLFIHNAPFVMYMIKHRIFEKFNKYLVKTIKRRRNRK